MRSSRSVVLASATVAFTLAAAGCGSSSSSGGGSSSGQKTFKVDFANYTEAAPLFHVIHTNLDQELSGQTAITVKWYDNGSDPAKMLQNAQLMTQDHPDAIIIYPVSTATAGVGKIIANSHIPCVTVNLDTPGCTFVNIDNKALGVDTAGIIGKIAQQRGWNASNTTVLIGENAAAGEQVNACVSNFYSTIAPMLGLSAVDASTITATTTTIGANGIQFDGVSQLQPSFQAVTNILPRIPSNHHIILYTVNNDSTNGALRALTDAGRAGNDNLLIGGLGGDQTGITALRTDPRWVAEGDIFVSWWGQYAVAAAQAIAAGGKAPVHVTPLPQIVLDKTTIDQYHLPNSLNVKSLPPLVPNNSYIKSSSVLQIAKNIQGI
jgi:ribose transport system substrate-binding protein